MSHKAHWLGLPEAICEQALARWGSGQRARTNRPGPGDGYRYHWLPEAPSSGYRGPLPTGHLLRRVKEGS